MKKLPSAMIIVDPRVEETAIKEARKLKIPVFGIVDTNCDPDMVDYVIPANDDAVRAVKLVIGALANAINEVNGGEMLNCVSPEDKANKPKKAEITKEDKTEEKIEKQEQETKQETNLEGLTLAELKVLAKEKEIKGYSTMKKADLLEALK